MGWRWHEGWFRSEGEISKIENERATSCFVAAVIVICLVWSAISSFLEWVGLKEPAPDKPAVVEVVDPPRKKTAPPEEEISVEPSHEDNAPGTAGEAPPWTPAPPTAGMARIAQLINTDPVEGTEALLAAYTGVWETTEQIVYSGEFGQREPAGLLFRVYIPENTDQKVSSQYTVVGAGEWLPWEESVLDVATGLFGGGGDSYATIRLSAVQDVIFITEEKLLFKMVTRPGQDAEMVGMKKVKLAATDLPQRVSEAEIAIREALTVFKDGTLDEAKVVVSRLEVAANQFPDDSTIPQLREHILAVFRAEHALSVIRGKIASADQLAAQRLEQARAAARQGGGDIDAAQASLRLAEQQRAQIQIGDESANRGLRDALRSAEEFCRVTGDSVEKFSDVLQVIGTR